MNCRNRYNYANREEKIKRNIGIDEFYIGGQGT